MIAAISTSYAGHFFRSRLEARWAVFFDHMEIPWLYEPEGYVINKNRLYLPDFYLPECGTWIEVKGSSDGLDLDLLGDAAETLPDLGPLVGERGPKLMLLGSIPDPMPIGDYAWASWTQGWRTHLIGRHGFGTYHKNNRPWWCWSQPEDFDFLTPTVEPDEYSNAQPAYRAARSARFEHGESGATLK